MSSPKISQPPHYFELPRKDRGLGEEKLRQNLRPVLLKSGNRLWLAGMSDNPMWCSFGVNRQVECKKKFCGVGTPQVLAVVVVPPLGGIMGGIKPPVIRFFSGTQRTNLSTNINTGGFGGEWGGTPPEKLDTGNKANRLG